jgi:hypothetical protein
LSFEFFSGGMWTTGAHCFNLLYLFLIQVHPVLPTTLFAPQMSFAFIVYNLFQRGHLQSWRDTMVTQNYTPMTERVYPSMLPSQAGML